MSRSLILVAGILVLVLGGGWYIFFVETDTGGASDSPELSNERSLSDITLTTFVSGIRHPYLTYEPGMQFVYETKGGPEYIRVEVEVLKETKEILGIDAMVIVDRDFEEGELDEKTESYMAQDIEGNVWILGEMSVEYKNGKKTEEVGWIAGSGNAKPGIAMKADSQPGDIYLNVYNEGEDETGIGVIGVHESISIQYGDFEDCLYVRDWSPQDPDEVAYKYYCSEIGGLVLDEIPAISERFELIDLKKPEK